MRFVQTLELKDNPSLIEAYKAQHSRQQMWPEIIEGIRQVGIEEMELYICGNQLVMIVDAPDDFDWDAAIWHTSQLYHANKNGKHGTHSSSNAPPLTPQTKNGI